MTKKLFLLIALLFNAILFAQNSVIPEDLSTPQSTVYVFTQYSQSDNPDYSKAAKTLKGVFGDDAAKKAEKLQKIFAGKGLKADITAIPSDANFTDTIQGVQILHRYVLFPSKLPEIYIEKSRSQWLFSKESVDMIDEIYNEVYPYGGMDFIKEYMPSFGKDKFLGVELWQLIGFVILVLAAFVLSFFLRKVVTWVLSKMEHGLLKYTNEYTTKGVKKISKPLTYILVMLLFEKFLPGLQLNVNITNFIFTGFDFGYVIFWVSIFLTIVQVAVDAYKEFAEKSNSKLDDQLVPIINNLLKGIVILGGVLKILTVIGVNPTSVLAGASIGGLALALSAQDTVKNLLGSFMIFLDKPFHIGDWIEAGSVVGSVEEVGFRSSRIRAADTSVFQIPNNQLAELIINNKGMRRYRRYTTTLGVRYDTPPQMMQDFIDGVREIIKAHPNTLSNKYNVEFQAFGASSLDIMVNVYFAVDDWNVEQSSKHRLHMAILTLANDMGVSFAFPSQTVMVEQFPDKTSFDMDYDTSKERVNSSLEKALKLLDNKEVN